MQFRHHFDRRIQQNMTRPAVTEDIIGPGPVPEFAGVAHAHVAAAAVSLVLTKFVQPPGVAFGFCRIHRGNLATESIAGGSGLLRGLDAADTAPTLARPGFNLAHLLDRMMGTAVIAEFGLIRHDSDCRS
jgi:hypothetical protein